jgi:biotin carboxylase
MSMVLMNKRRILRDVLRWFPDSREQLAVLTDRRSAALLDRGERARFHIFEVVDDYDGESTVQRAASLCRQTGADRILTTAEVDVIRAAELREELGIPGQRRESARAYRDKYVMKSIVAEAGIRTAAMGLVEDRRSACRWC